MLGVWEVGKQALCVWKGLLDVLVVIQKPQLNEGGMNRQLSLSRFCLQVFVVKIVDVYDRHSLCPINIGQVELRKLFNPCACVQRKQRQPILVGSCVEGCVSLGRKNLAQFFQRVALCTLCHFLPLAAGQGIESFGW